jgi:Flp pilus assembly protein TadD/predicted Zn-dependent protease with MMP-like domain
VAKLGVPAKKSADGSAAEPEVLSVACDLASQDPTVIIDEASSRYRGGDFVQAFACARMAVDLAPQAVAAHHLQAAALTGLARYEEAQVAFAMALALDPDDPETLADVADFYINILPPKSRDTILVGLQYARRGGGRAATGRRYDVSLQARLLLLEAEALNDLGQSNHALPRAIEALELAPGIQGAEHERAVSLFRLLRFEESEEAFLRVLTQRPDDAYAHHHLGLLYERAGRVADAEAHLLRARRLSPSEFPEPVLLSVQEFRAELSRAIEELEPAHRELLAAATLEVEDLPSIEDLGAAEPPFSPTILGLYRGLPVGVDPTPGSKAPARAVVLYRMNLGRASHSRAELNRQIRHTLRHEIGHLQGYDEDELRRRGLE